MLKIMIVDDCERIGYSLSELFKLKGHEAKYIHNASTALNFAKSQEADEYDYILIDLYLNGVSGIDIYQAIENKGIANKVIFISGCNVQNDIFQTAIQKKVPMVVKKFNSLELLEHLESGDFVDWTRIKLIEKGIDPLY